MVDFKGMVSVVWRWLSPKENTMPDEVQDSKEVIQEVVQEVAPADGAPGPTQAPAQGKAQTWDERYNEGVAAIRTSNTNLRSVRGQVEGARKGVEETEKAMTDAIAELDGARADVTTATANAIADIDIQKALLDERRAALVNAG